MSQKLSDIITKLPTELLGVLESVSEKTGITVSIKEYDENILTEMLGLSKAAAVLDIDPARESITIWVWPNLITPAQLAHEIIHLRRSIIESVPKIFPVSSANNAETQEIHLFENEIEHQFVIPEEIKWFPEAESWWIDHYEKQIEKSKINGFSLSLHWCLLRTVFANNEAILKACISHLKAFNNKDLLQYANDFQIYLRDARPNKMEMIGVMLDYIPKQIRPKIIIGRYIISNGKLVTEILNNS